MEEENREDQTIQSAEEMEALEGAAEHLIRNHVYVSLGIGLLPIPFLDFVGVTGAQLNLLRKLSQLYNVPFSKDMVKNLIGALIGGAFPASFGARIGGSMAKIIPGVGHIIGAAGTSAVSGAATYAVGKVFNRHFAEGGTFLSFDVEEARAYYAEMFREGQGVAGNMEKEQRK